MKTLNRETQKQILEEIEEYVKKTMDDKNTEVKAHDWKHAFRVRNWALKIAKGEGYENTFFVETAALIHDLGRLRERELQCPHAQASAIMVKEYLEVKRWFSQEEQEEIIYAVAHHSKGGKTQLTHILQDADRLDGFGAMGLIRMLQSKWNLPDYDAVQGIHPFVLNKNQVNEFYEHHPKGSRGDIVRYAIDFFPYVISWYERMNTETGKELAKPLIEYTKAFLEEFTRESKV